MDQPDEDVRKQVDQTNLTIGPFLQRTRIAYFSMEIAIRPEMHTYSGGLGVLAGDTARSCADLDLPIVFVTLLSRQGYLRQEIDGSGWQIEHPDPWIPKAFATPLRSKVAVPIENREVWVRPWLHVIASPSGASVPILLLDTDLEENHPEDRRITDHLYGGDDAYRLKQEIVLGICGLRVLAALGFTIRLFHLNEGHAALLALDLLRRHPRPLDQIKPGDVRYDVGRVREACVFTTHTPVEAGHDRFSYGLVHQLLSKYIDLDQIKILGGEHELNMTRLALRLSGYINGVASRHAATTGRMFPGYRIHGISNGVHLATWAHASFGDLYKALVPRWEMEPETLSQADQLDSGKVWKAHMTAKQDLVNLVAKSGGCVMDVKEPIIGFARRMTSYKRPELLFSDLARLTKIYERFPFQIVLSGKAHPRDQAGKAHIQAIHRHIARFNNKIPIAFLPNYDLSIAKALIAGVDIWLNTPEPPLEASGTSGMKAAVNGVLNLSVLDGWWVDACIDGVNGWAIGGAGDQPRTQEATQADLYAKLEDVVLPLYYHDNPQWIGMMKAAISKIAAYFNTHRMMRRYSAEAYVRWL